VTLRLEVRHGTARPALYEVTGDEFLIGSVPGCDLRLPGTNLPPVVAQITRRTDGYRLRKLAPAHPIFVNGQPINQAVLAHKDMIAIGPVELVVQMNFAAPPEPAAVEYAPPASPPPAQTYGPAPVVAPPVVVSPVAYVPAGPIVAPGPATRNDSEFQRLRTVFEARQRELDEKQKLLEDQAAELDADRVLWYRRRDEIEKECRRQQDEAVNLGRQLRDRERQLTEARAEVDRQEAACERQRLELAKLRDELTALRREMEDRYQTGRTELNHMQGQMQDEATRLRDLRTELEQRSRDLDNRERALKTRAEELARHFENDTEFWQDPRVRERAARLDAHETALSAREDQLTADREIFNRLQAQYQADLARLDRQREALEQKERDLVERGRHIDLRYEQLRRDAVELEQQARDLDTAQERNRAEAERLAKQKADQDHLATQLAERTATLDGQQATLAALRTRLERMREELRKNAQQLAADRARNEEIAAELRQKLDHADQVRTGLDTENRFRTDERAKVEARAAALHAAVVQLKELQERLAGEERRLRERGEAIDAQAAEHAEQLGLMKARAAQVMELQERLEADRTALRERERAIVEAEETRKTLQEQLRRRGEELAARSRQLDEQAQLLDVRKGEVDKLREQLEAERREAEARILAARSGLDNRDSELQRLVAGIAQREENLQRNVEKLREAGRILAGDRKALFEARACWEADQRNTAEQLRNARNELDAFRRDTLEQARDLQKLLPELELQGQGAADKLGQARDQIRQHLAELHAYARQGQDELQVLREQVQGEVDRLRQQELFLHRARSEHRLAVTAFRQQLIDWQGRVNEMKHLFAQNETRLELKQTLVDEAAKRIDADANALARQAELIRSQQREVEERRGELERHLNDMREWYRRKLRELAASGPLKVTDPSAVDPANDVNDPVAGKPGAGRDILTVTGEVDAGDRALGEKLLTLGLVEPDMLSPLWAEARRQRRSLRQILLNSGAVTLYQLALIEAGNLDGLMVGPLRVIDRLQANPREAVFRVFDPREVDGKPRGLCLLRHLADAEMHDATHPDEYRQRFGALAALQHPNLTATYEVREVSGRPAVLQEWVRGVASSDWPALAAAPGAWYRLLCQATLGVRAAHDAGLSHGHLNADDVVLTGDGTVKLAGFGEPAWLAPARDNPPDPIVADLRALGRLAASWLQLAPRPKRSRAKILPDVLIDVLRKLGAEVVIDDKTTIPAYPEPERFSSASAVLIALDDAGTGLPANAEAWERLVRYAGENAVENLPMRRTA
jgi:chromosome segregation ATPase